MARKHRVTGIQTVYSIECGKCGHEFEEKGGDQMSQSYPDELTDGTPLECPECGEELDCHFDDGSEDE
jgi:DNA-directed RNA polymerase subunit RPC12/RpoP